MKIQNHSKSSFEEENPQNDFALILIDSNSCRMPAHVGSYRQKNESGQLSDEDYMGDIHTSYPLRITPAEETDHEEPSPYKLDENGQIVNMRVDIRMKRSGKNLLSVERGVVAPPSSPNASLTRIQNTIPTRLGSNIADDRIARSTSVNETLNVNETQYPYSYINNKTSNRNRSAPPFISQYRQRILSTSNQYIRQRAVATNTNIKPCVVIPRQKASTAVRPFSEREKKKFQNPDTVTTIEVKHSNNARVTGPDLGSFRGKNTLPNNVKRWKINKIKSSSNLIDQASENQTLTHNSQSNVDSIENHDQETFLPNRIEQYVSELRRNLRSSTIDYFPKPVPYTAWAHGTHTKDGIVLDNGDGIFSPNNLDSIVKKPGDSRYIEDTKHLPQKAPINKGKKIRQEILARLSKETEMENIQKELLSVTGDSPPGSIQSNQVYSANARQNQNLSMNARKSTNRYIRQFHKNPSTSPGSPRVSIPAYIELKPINRDLLQAHSFYQTNKINRSQVFTSPSNNYQFHTAPFSRNLIEKNLI